MKCLDIHTRTLTHTHIEQWETALIGSSLVRSMMMLSVFGVESSLHVRSLSLGEKSQKCVMCVQVISQLVIVSFII